MKMAKKEESEFLAWFVAQHGQRPSQSKTHELQAEYMRAQELLNTCRRLLEQCNDYDARETSSLYAWHAARSTAGVTGSGEKI
jgi:hypothetical protein